ncbi:hypothetical protein TNCV_3337701 [Trichonephila clavipes]|nr:hypothetical protein TNCV_3337701 [Trichonephila clavipes]
MSRFGGLSEERPSVFKTRSKLGTHLSTQCSGDERQSRPCAARNRDYTGMWVRLGSTDLMAGKIMFLRSNQGGRFDGNESVADSFRSDLVNFKSSCTTILGAFTPSSSARKTLHFREAHLLPEVNPIRRSLPLSKLSNIQLCVT